MKKILFTLLALCVLFTASLTAQIQADLEIKKGWDIEIDGKPDDAIWSLIDPVAIERNFQAEEPSVTAFFKMFYTDTNLYLLIDVTDDVHYPVWQGDKPKEPWIYDKVEVYFDVNDILKDGKGPNHNGANVPPVAPGHAQMAPNFAEGEYDIPFLPTDAVYSFLSGQVYVAYSMKEDNNSYTIEYDFALDAFVNDRDETLDVNAFKALPNGMGFDITVVDNDNDGKGRKRAVWRSQTDEAYTNMDGCGVIVFGDEIIPNSLNNTSMPSIKFYPNPVKDFVTIEGEFDQIVFTNMAGQQVKVAEKAKTINVNDLADGLYILKIYENGICKGISKITKE